MQTKFIPLVEYSSCNFSSEFLTLPLLTTLFSIVSKSKGSAAANIIASISLSKLDLLEGNFTTLLFFSILSSCSYTLNAKQIM